MSADPIELPSIGTTAGGTLTIDQESIYGEAYMRMLRNSYPIVNDPVLNEYIDSLGHRLVANANDVKTPFTFFMIRDRNINAFAFLVVMLPCIADCSCMQNLKVNSLLSWRTRLPTSPSDTLLALWKSKLAEHPQQLRL
ncbi:exported zinc metalloprotease YfgC precursor [Vibrio astriarenae]|nr:exported zinc metalloprotease YfgC precursor [Vibrio sp. C7]